MNIQGYGPIKEEAVAHQFQEDRIKSSNMLPTLMEEEYDTTTGATSSSSTPVQQQQQNEASSSSQEDSLNPALLLNRYDKRKSSPAILGLPFGLNHEAQLSLHLSQQRNSIEAAMLLANFNKLMAFPKANEVEHKGNKNKIKKKNKKKGRGWGRSMFRRGKKKFKHEKRS